MQWPRLRRSASQSGQIAPGDELRAVDGWDCTRQTIENISVRSALPAEREVQELIQHSVKELTPDNPPVT